MSVLEFYNKELGVSSYWSNVFMWKMLKNHGEPGGFTFSTCHTVLENYSPLSLHRLPPKINWFHSRERGVMFKFCDILILHFDLSQKGGLCGACRDSSVKGSCFCKSVSWKSAHTILDSKTTPFIHFTWFGTSKGSGKNMYQNWGHETTNAGFVALNYFKGRIYYIIAIFLWT